MPDEGTRAVAEQRAEVDAAFVKRAGGDFLLYLDGLVIPSASGPQPFRHCMAPFQRETFRDLAPSLHALRDGELPPCRRFWIERTKKASKDADVAACILWLMAFPRRPLKGQICAGTRQQANIIHNRVVELLYYNPWLALLTEVVEGKIRNREMSRETWTHIEATDSSGGAHGEAPELLVLNELVHVARWQAMEDHMNNASGVPRGIVIICTNAGIKGTPAEKWKQNAKDHPERWHSHVWLGKAPWLDDGDVEEARRRDPVGSEFARLWQGRWVSGTGGAVDEEAIDACFAGLHGPLPAPEPGWIYLGGLDLGVSHDHAGMVVLGVDRRGQRIRLARMEAWEPAVKVGNKREVDLMAVEEGCLSVARQLQVAWFGYDPAAGGSFMAQRLRQQGVPMKEMTFASPTNLTLMAKCFVQAVGERRLECWDTPDGRLRRDFGKFRVAARVPAGYKLEAVSDEWGHADVGTALVICLPRAMELLSEAAVVPEDGVLLTAGTRLTLTREEEAAMPDDLRDIYDAYDPWALQKLAHGRRGRAELDDDRFDL